MKRIQLFFLAILIAGSVVVTGCDGFLGSSPVEGQMRVLMTDAPGDILEANVTIERVEVVGEDEETVVLTSESQEFDLLELQEGVTAELADVSIPEGEYNQLRIVVAEEANVGLEGEDEEEILYETLKVPSGTETGIKIQLPEFDISEESDEVEVLVDFSVEESFVKAGSTETYLFKPVIKREYFELNGVSEEGDEENGGDDE